MKGKFAQKADRARTAHIEFEKIINELKTYRRGTHFDKEKFINDTIKMEDFIINETPIIPNWISKKYEKKFKVHIKTHKKVAGKKILRY